MTHTLKTFILLDRSGSMQSLWTEALSSIDAYVAELAAPVEETGETIEAQITLATFDTAGGATAFDVVRREAEAASWLPLEVEHRLQPRGMTPLYDAIGQILDLAMATDETRGTIVIMTDGHENASREYTATSARGRIKDAKRRGWEIIYLGANFADFGDARRVGIAASKSMGVERGRMIDAKRRVARMAKAYSVDIADSVDFDELDRRRAGEDDI